MYYASINRGRTGYIFLIVIVKFCLNQLCARSTGCRPMLNCGVVHVVAPSMAGFVTNDFTVAFHLLLQI